MKADRPAGGQAHGPAVDLGPLLKDAGVAGENGTLVVGGVPLPAIARALGTPAYIYNAEVIRARYRALDQAFAGIPHRLCYAIKANSNLAVLRIFRDLGAGADIVSGGEMRRALAAGFAPDHVVFSGVGKTTAELAAAVEAGLGHVHLESVEEMTELARIAGAGGRRMKVGIRVNPDVSASTHPYISTGQGGIKFGVPHDQVLPLAEAIHRSGPLELDTIAMHLGSQLLDPGPYVEGLGRLLALIERIRAAGIDTLRHLDIGGGLGIRYRDETPLNPARVAEAVIPLVKPTGLTLVLEPGRYLVGTAGILLTRVLSRKHSGGKDLVIVDAGMNDLVRPSHYGAWHGIAEVEAHGRPEARVDVVGPVCETGDFLALDRSLPGLARGDLLAVLGAGAYGFVMSSTYNTRPRPAEVLVDRGRWAVVRPRIREDEIFAQE
ncbi:MAG: diaminopimelate decarboxylase, partial [Gemmatimonadales bacterium]